MAKFVCDAYPELRLDIHDGEGRVTVQFAGGTAEAAGKTAEAVKKVAADRPDLQIRPAGSKASEKDAD